MVQLLLKNKGFLLSDAMIGLYIISFVILLVVSSTQVTFHNKGITNEHIQNNNESFHTMLDTLQVEEICIEEDQSY